MVFHVTLSRCGWWRVLRAGSLRTPRLHDQLAIPEDGHVRQVELESDVAIANAILGPPQRSRSRTFGNLHEEDFQVRPTPKSGRCNRVQSRMPAPGCPTSPEPTLTGGRSSSGFEPR